MVELDTGEGKAYGMGASYSLGYGTGVGLGYGEGWSEGVGDSVGEGEGVGLGYGVGVDYGVGVGLGYGVGVGDGAGVGVEREEGGQLREYVQALVASGALTARHALVQQNVALKHLIIECLGPDRFFTEVQATVVHQDTDGHGNPRRLLRVPMAEARGGYLQAVHVICPTTGREYCLGVGPDMSTCQEAVASTFGLAAWAYHPLRET